MPDDMEQETRLSEKIEQAASMIVRSRRMVVTTGAGISKESGIPTFRDPEGLWSRYKTEELATREAYLSDPKLVWGWYRERLRLAREVEPNPAHFALVELEKLLPRFLLVTQNVDNLHRRAGSREIIELHGCIERYRCFDYAHPAQESPDWGDEPPRCHCGSLIRPNVVWFGEPLPEAELECAFGETQRCDLLLVIGTSGLVYPAARLPNLAKQVGANVIEVNTKSSEITHTSDLFLEGESGKILPEIVALVRKSLSGHEEEEKPDR